ncbi:periplasmic heavy metal sensor [bacterium]|nr:periplasmic heavy metal sensor [bacterium]
MKKKITILLLMFFVSTVFASAFGGFGSFGKQKDHRRRGGFNFRRIIAKGHHLMEELDLTDEQQTKIQGIMVDAAVNIIPTGAELLVAKIKLMVELKKDDPDMKVINPLIDSSAENLKKITKSAIEAVIMAKKVLTPEQKKKLKETLKKFRHGKRHGQRGKGHGLKQGHGKGFGFGKGRGKGFGFGKGHGKGFEKENHHSKLEN